MDWFRIRSLFASGFILAQCAAASASPQSSLFEGPVIRFQERQVDFGELKQASHATHRFEFSNDGTEPLRIEKVEASCGCTAAAPTDSLILPGQSSAIEITFSTRDFQGNISKVVAVYTNDPAEPRVDLVLRADIVPIIRLGKEWVDFGPVQRGSNQTAAVLISADEGTDFRIERIEGGEAFVDWRVVPASAPQGIAYRVEATLKPEVPFGPFADRVQVHVHHPNKQYERIGLRGNVYSYFRYERGDLEFNTIKLGKTVRRTFEITSDGSKPYEITDVILDSDFLIPQLERTKRGYELHVTLRTEDAKFTGPRFQFEENARLITTDPSQQEIVIAIKGVIRS
jgi:hypothetical protein